MTPNSTATRVARGAMALLLVAGLACSRTKRDADVADTAVSAGDVVVTDGEPLPPPSTPVDTLALRSSTVPLTPPPGAYYGNSPRVVVMPGGSGASAPPPPPSSYESSSAVYMPAPASPAARRPAPVRDPAIDAAYSGSTPAARDTGVARRMTPPAESLKIAEPPQPARPTPAPAKPADPAPARDTSAVQRDSTATP